MPKNIVIFSDGTGQRAGLTFDERRSNVYKLFRAARSGPDSQIDPSEQVTFYDAGVGTAAPGASLVGRLWVWVFNLISRATGLGLTTNVVETYAAIIREWEEGDRIFLFGFSRGAYTMRLLGGVLSLCGVPTKQPDGSLRIDGKGSKKIARRAVTRVYQHAASKVGTAGNPLSEKEKMYLDQRRLLAEAFREEYGSFDENAPEQSNTVPHFIGVYDTVASLFHPAASALIAVAAVIVLAVISLGLTFFGAPFWQSFLSLIGLVTTFSVIWFLGKTSRYPERLAPILPGKPQGSPAICTLRILSSAHAFHMRATQFQSTRSARSSSAFRGIGKEKQTSRTPTARFHSSKFGLQVFILISGVDTPRLNPDYPIRHCYGYSKT